MIVSVDNTSPVPPYEQVRSSLAQQINDRTLPVGTKLPTVRKLAADLGIAPNTIARAYRELEEAGLIETRGRAGSFVGASGDQGRQRAQQAAADYASITRKLGLSQGEALAIVSAALEGNVTPIKALGLRERPAH
ncbi:DNA-binding transcriptional regulator YhcF, GntR family [Amycolatopsis xylanica]|uniref:DNA-binding transcriptional regulator YhcF, GntR family n=1 Tax=Amycolatopsis xylanica TaxID=589385 RepID=A0A1H3M917_9PSEU|nr:GntR family transcriptional regulator [Amycolatopsis xylanica]SDY73066.1 DNA-binding transcriptional regulator YhcF, GntR family [Amycolatopsis xylanica]